MSYNSLRDENLILKRKNMSLESKVKYLERQLEGQGITRFVKRFVKAFLAAWRAV
jgi:hypothetical protein